MWTRGVELGGLVGNVGRMWMLREREWEFYGVKGRWRVDYSGLFDVEMRHWTRLVGEEE